MEFENWTDSIIKSTIFEKKDDRGERAIDRQRDIVYKAKQAFPEYPESQAIELFLADKLSDIEQRDFEQNKVINLQRRENDKLKSNLQGLQAEINSIEAGGQETDREIARLKQLSGKLQTDVEQRRVGGREINELLAQVEQLKNKPGVTPEQYKEIKDKVEDFSKQKVNPDELKKFSSQLSTLAASEAIDKQEISNLRAALNSVTSRQEKIGDISDVASKLRDLESKQSEIEQVANSNKELVGDINQRLETLGATDRADIERASELLRDLQGTKQELDAKQQELTDFEQNLENSVNQQLAQERARTRKYRENVRKRSKQASTKVNAFFGKDATVDQIKNFGQKTNKLVSDLTNNPADELNDYLSILDLNTGIDSLDGEQKNISNELRALNSRIGDIETVLLNKKNTVSAKPSPSKVVSDIYLNKDDENDQRSNKDIKEMKLTKINEDRYVYKKYKQNQEIYQAAIERWCLISKEFCDLYNQLNELFNTYSVEIIIHNYFKRLNLSMDKLTSKTEEDQAYRNKLDRVILPFIIDNFSNLVQSKKDRMGLSNSNPIDKGLSELEESLDRIIGKDVATWIKR